MLLTLILLGVFFGAGLLGTVGLLTFIETAFTLCDRRGSAGRRAVVQRRSNTTDRTVPVRGARPSDMSL